MLGHDSFPKPFFDCFVALGIVITIGKIILEVGNVYSSFQLINHPLALSFLDDSLSLLINF